jgi:GNAT superfamily N-acetyltransferase
MIGAFAELRFSHSSPVHENQLSNPNRISREDYRAMLAGLGRGWLFEDENGRVIAFGVADASQRNIWALFVDPAFEGRGLGRSLLDVMTAWLFEQGEGRIWLTTAPGTRAERFYRAAGWQDAGRDRHGEIRFERAAR